MISSAVHKPSQKAGIRLVLPFPGEAIPLIWEWVNESPEKYFDDYTLETREEFISRVHQQLESQHIWGVLKNGELVGMVGYLPYNKKVGSFCGIVFTKTAWDSGTAVKALRMIIKGLFCWGIEKIAASYFADDLQARRSLKDLGAVEEGLLRKQNWRDGIPVDTWLVAIFREDWNRKPVSHVN